MKKLYTIQGAGCDMPVFSTEEAAQHYCQLITLPENPYEDPPKVVQVELDPEVPEFASTDRGFNVTMIRDGSYTNTTQDAVLMAHRWRNRVVIFPGQSDYPDPTDMLMCNDTLYMDVVAPTSRAALEKVDQYRKKLIEAGVWPEVVETEIKIEDASNILRDPS